MDIPSPCYFSSYKGKVQQKTYKDLKNAIVFAVFGGIIEPSKDEKYPVIECQLRGVVIMKDSIKATKELWKDGSTACGTLDEKVLWMLSHW